VRGEAEAMLEVARVVDNLIDGADFTIARSRIRVAEEAVGGEGDAVAQAPAEDVANGDVPRLPEDVEAGELEGGQDLRAVVVEGRRGIGDLEAHLLETRGVVAHEVRLHGAEDGFGRFAAASHFSEPDEPGIGFYFDDGADEAAPVAAIGMAERRFQGDRYRGRADIPNLHVCPILFHRTTKDAVG
jgi:hypothetical protein